MSYTLFASVRTRFAPKTNIYIYILFKAVYIKYVYGPTGCVVYAHTYASGLASRPSRSVPQPPSDNPYAPWPTDQQEWMLVGVAEGGEFPGLIAH